MLTEQPEHYIISAGPLTASEHEIADGYFGVAQKTAVMVEPGSMGWLRLRELVGKPITLIARVDR